METVIKPYAPDTLPRILSRYGGGEKYALQSRPSESTLAVALTFMFIAGFLPSAANGLQFSIVQAVVKVRMRALASSLHFMCANLFGMALAPLAVGLFNDALKGRFGDLAIRYSMLSTAPSAILAGLFLVWGARYIKQDVRRAMEEGMVATGATASP
jgi:hypothetical protein